MGFQVNANKAGRGAPALLPASALTWPSELTWVEKRTPSVEFGRWSLWACLLSGDGDGYTEMWLRRLSGTLRGRVPSGAGRSRLPVPSLHAAGKRLGGTPKPSPHSQARGLCFPFRPARWGRCSLLQVGSHLPHCGLPQSRPHVLLRIPKEIRLGNLEKECEVCGS